MKLIRGLVFIMIICMTRSEEPEKPEETVEQSPTESKEKEETEPVSLKDEVEEVKADKVPDLDPASLMKMEKMMKMFSGMHCMMTMDSFLKSKSDVLKDLNSLPNPKARFEKVIISLYGKCKESTGDQNNLEGMLKGMTGQGEAPDTSEMYKGVDLLGIMEMEDLTLSEQENKLLVEFKQLEDEMKKQQQEAQKKEKAKKSKKKESSSEKIKSKPKSKQKKKSSEKRKKKKRPRSKGIQTSNFGGLVAMVVVILFLIFAWQRLFSEEGSQKLKNKKQKKKNLKKNK